MASATLSFSNLQQHEQTWSTDTATMSPKSPEPAPEWGQSDTNNSSFNQSGEPPKIIIQNLENPDSSESDEIIFNHDEKNRELRECLKNLQPNDDPDKANWNYFKTLLEQEGHEKAQMAYLEHIKNERVLACLQAYKVHEEAKYQWSERQRIKEEQLNQYKQLICLEETAAQNRMNQQALSEIDYFKSKWESYALPANTGISSDLYRELLNKGKLANSQENLDLLQQNAGYLQYNPLTADLQQANQIHGNVQELLEVDHSKYYINSGLQDHKLNAQYLPQHSIQKLSSSAPKRVITKGDSNTLDDIMADFQSNGRDSTAPPSPRASRAWSTGSVPSTSPISVRPNLQNLRQISSPAASPNSMGNLASNVISSAGINPLASSLPRGADAELLRQIMLMNLGTTSAHLQKQNMYASQAQYGLQLGGLADSQFRRRRVTVSSTECAFCRNNGEQPAVYRGHILKDADGRVRCPILRDYTCRNCGATGDMAHTVKYCPLTPKTELSFTQLQKNLRMANGKRRGSQEIAQWTSCDSP